MEGLFIFLHIAVSLIIILLVLLQPSKATGGLSGMMSGGGGTGGTETFFGKNKSRTYEGKLKRFTVIAMICFVLTSMMLIYLTNN